MNKFTKKVFNPHFHRGMAELYDNASVREAVFRVVEQDDGEAVRKDWERVGRDMYKAIFDYERRYTGAARAAA